MYFVGWCVLLVGGECEYQGGGFVNIFDFSRMWRLCELQVQMCFVGPLVSLS